MSAAVFLGDVLVPADVCVADNSAGLPEVDLIIGEETYVVTVLDAWQLAAALEDAALAVFRSQPGGES
jgi:septum formation inhibitor-activating ATPase MinD